MLSSCIVSSGEESSIPPVLARTRPCLTACSYDFPEQHIPSQADPQRPQCHISSRQVVCVQSPADVCLKGSHIQRAASLIWHTGCLPFGYHLPQSSADDSSAFFFASPPVPLPARVALPAAGFRAAATAAAGLASAGADDSHSSSSHVASVQTVMGLSPNVSNSPTYRESLSFLHNDTRFRNQAQVEQLIVSSSRPAQ